MNLQWFIPVSFIAANAIDRFERINFRSHSGAFFLLFEDISSKIGKNFVTAYIY